MGVFLLVVLREWEYDYVLAAGVELFEGSGMRKGGCEAARADRSFLLAAVLYPTLVLDGIDVRALPLRTRTVLVERRECSRRARKMEEGLKLLFGRSCGTTATQHTPFERGVDILDL